MQTRTRRVQSVIHRRVRALAASFSLSLLISPLSVASQPEDSDQIARSGVPLPRGELIEKFGPASSPSPESGIAITENQQVVPESQQALKRQHAQSPTASLSGEQRRLVRGEEGVGRWPFLDALPLLAVLAMIGAIALVVKRCMPARRLLTGAGVLDIIARVPLSGKQSLVLVKMGRRLILLGVTPDRVSSLDVVDDPDEAASLIGEVASQKSDSMTSAFADAFRREAHAYVEEPIGQNAASSARGHVQGLLEKVRGLARLEVRSER